MVISNPLIPILRIYTMEEFKNCFLVPYDFTDVADNAVHHAVLLSKVKTAEVVLLNIVKKESEIEEFSVKLLEETKTS